MNLFTIGKIDFTMIQIFEFPVEFSHMLFKKIFRACMGPGPDFAGRGYLGLRISS